MVLICQPPPPPLKRWQHNYILIDYIIRELLIHSLGRSSSTFADEFDVHKLSNKRIIRRTWTHTHQNSSITKPLGAYLQAIHYSGRIEPGTEGEWVIDGESQHDSWYLTWIKIHSLPKEQHPFRVSERLWIWLPTIYTKIATPENLIFV